MFFPAALYQTNGNAKPAKFAAATAAANDYIRERLG
jgi:hypothetical protein